MSDSKNSVEREDVIVFSVDGRKLQTRTARMQVRSVLELAGLDPLAYDLAEVRPGNAQPKRYRDEEFIKLKDGDSFVTIRQSAPVA